MILTMTISGCIDSAMMITVNKDGSGTIVQEMYLSAQASAMMQGFGGAEAGGAGGGSMLDFDEAKYRAMAADLGEGVTFVKGGPATKENGSKGVQVNYAFEDITKVKLPMMIDPKEADAGKEEKSLVTFGFDKKGGESVLTINVPQDKDNQNADKPVEHDGVDTPADAAPDAQADMAAAMMKPMLEGMRIRAYVKVDGEITDSTASYVSNSSQTGKKQMVTLMDMQLGKLVADPEKAKKLTALGEIKDPVKAAEMLKEFPEVRYELKEKISVNFK
jgi:hypothetical protein